MRMLNATGIEFWHSLLVDQFGLSTCNAEMDQRFIKNKLSGTKRVFAQITK